MPLKREDLRDTILPLISIDEYEPKSGTVDEIIVVGFYVIDEEPAKDLDDFVEKGSYQVYDVDVSPNPDDEGRYMVFVEFAREEDFVIKLLDVVRDIENVSGKLKWEAILPSGETLDLLDKSLSTKIDYHREIEQTPEEFLEAAGLTVRKENSFLIAESYTHRMRLRFVDFGDLDKLMEKHHLKTQPMKLRNSYDARRLQSMLGHGWVANEFDKNVVITNENTDKILIVRL